MTEQRTREFQSKTERKIRQFQSVAGQRIRPFQSIHDTSGLLGLSEFELRKRIKEGTVKFTKSGNKYYINIPDLLKREGLTMADLEPRTQFTD